MPDANINGSYGMALRWRIVCLLILVSFQTLLIWSAIRFGSGRDWGYLAIVVFGVVTLLVTGYEVVQKGMLTRLTFCFWIGFTVGTLGRDIIRAHNHSSNMDPAGRLFSDAVLVVLCIVWIWRNPSGNTDSKETNLGLKG